MQWRRGKAYSQDLRERVFALCDAGDAVGEIADALCVSVSYVSKALSRRRDTGETSARPQRCHVAPKLFGLHDAIRAEVASRPGATQAELRRGLGLTHKKRRCMPPSRSARTLRLRVPTGRSSSPA